MALMGFGGLKDDLAQWWLIQPMGDLAFQNAHAVFGLPPFAGNDQDKPFARGLGT